MIKYDTNIEELLSAYLDDELSQQEKDNLEQKINSSPELQNKLNDLREIKETVSRNYKRLPESPYFETRLFAELKSHKPWHRKVIKWSPAIGLGLATIFLMVVLKFNPEIIDDLINEQSSNIAGFYKENLQPLLFAADLNNEDIFNFAMYKQLPINKEENQILHLGYDTTGREYFEIKDIDENLGKNNYEKFVVAMGLDENQKRQIDSIINQYAAELEDQILVNVNNTVAINSNLWNYQRAIQTDLLAFAENSNELQFRKLLPKTISSPNSPVIIKAANDFRKVKNKNYIMLTPDSIFAENIEFKLDSYTKNIDRLEKNLNEKMRKLEKINISVRYDTSWNNPNVKHSWQQRFDISIDSNSCRVDFSEFDIPVFDLHDFHSTFNSFDSIAENFKYYSKYIPQIEYLDNKIKFDFNTDSVKTYEFSITDFDMDSLMQMQFERIDSVQQFNFNNFFNFRDSMMFRDFPKIDSYFKYYHSDEDIKTHMEELQKELEIFKKEMKEWDSKFKDRSSSRKQENDKR